MLSNENEDPLPLQEEARMIAWQLPYILLFTARFVSEELPQREVTPLTELPKAPQSYCAA
jgi:hypothetical protein